MYIPLSWSSHIHGHCSGREEYARIVPIHQGEPDRRCHDPLLSSKWLLVFEIGQDKEYGMEAEKLPVECDREEDAIMVLSKTCSPAANMKLSNLAASRAELRLTLSRWRVLHEPGRHDDDAAGNINLTTHQHHPHQTTSTQYIFDTD